MHQVLALQELVMESNVYEGYLDQSQATNGAECSYGSVLCVPPHGVEAGYDVI